MKFLKYLNGYPELILFLLQTQILFYDYLTNENKVSDRSVIFTHPDSKMASGWSTPTLQTLANRTNASYYKSNKEDKRIFAAAA